MKLFIRILRFFFNRYWHLSIKNKHNDEHFLGYDWILNEKKEYIGYAVYGNHRSQQIVVEMYFYNTYKNKDYAIVAMMIHWRLYCQGFYLTEDNKIYSRK